MEWWSGSAAAPWGWEALKKRRSLGVEGGDGCEL